MSVEKKSDKPLIASVSVGLGDAPNVPEQERPRMRVVVVAEAGPNVDHGVADGAGGFVRVRDVDEAMASLQMRVVVDIEVPLVDGARERVEVPVDALRALRPSGLVERVGALAALVEARRALSSAAGSEESRIARERALASASPAMKRALEELFQAPASAPSLHSVNTPSAKRSAIDDLFDRVEVGSPSPATSAVAEVARSVVNTSDPSIPARLRRIDDAFARTLRSLVDNRELRRLDRVWSSMKLLRAHAGEDVNIDLVAIPAHASADALEAVAEHAATSGEEVDLIVLDPGASTTSSDVARLQACAEQAERMHAPLIASTAPESLGLDDLSALARSQRRLGSPGDARSASLQAFMSRDTARWVCLALNGPLLRAPHRGNVAGVPFAEDESAFVAAIPSFALAALVSRAFGRDGWPAPHEGPRHGAIEGLAVRETDGALPSPLEHSMPLEAQKAAARAGVAVFGAADGTDRAILAFAPMAYRGATLATGGDPPATLTLADQMLVGRMARLLTGLAAEIPSGTAPNVVQEVALSVLAAAFPHGDRPRVEASSDGRSLKLRIDGSGWRGVTISNLELAAPLSS